MVASVVCPQRAVRSTIRAPSRRRPMRAESRSEEADSDGPRSIGLRPMLRWYHLVGVTFFAVCGGDYGIEESVGAAGPGLTLLGLIVLPWFWSLPIALMTAELGSMIPEAGGYVVWIHRAFGPRLAHLNAVWNLVSNAFDNALYPVMFVDYLHYFPALRLSGLPRWLLSVSMLGGVTSVNLLGVDVVAQASSLFALLAISPFAALVVAGLPRADPAIWFAGPSHAVQWGPFLNVLLWNTSGYDSVGALAAEVERPGRDFPLAMVVTIMLVTFVYILPVAIGVSLDKDNLDAWEDGHFTTVAAEHVGDWLSAMISMGAALSSAGLLNTLLCTSARVAVSAARLRVLPAALAVVHEESGVPRTATLVLSAVISILCLLPFSELVQISMCFYGATTFCEFLSLLKLRTSEPFAPRPFRLPMSTCRLTICCLPAMALCLLLVALSPPLAKRGFLVTTAIGLLSFQGIDSCSVREAVQRMWRRRGRYRNVVNNATAEDLDVPLEPLDPPPAMRFGAAVEAINVQRMGGEKDSVHSRDGVAQDGATKDAMQQDGRCDEQCECSEMQRDVRNLASDHESESHTY